MSAQFVQNFLPASVSWAEHRPFLRYILTALFPTYIQEICPLPVLRLQGDRPLKWPTVAALCFCGCILGFISGGYMLCCSLTRKRQERGFFSWGFLFLWYGVMCLGGLFHHCLGPSSFFYKMDVIGTACFSISIIPGSILADDTSNIAQILLLAIYGGVIFLSVFGSQIMLEVLYSGPMVFGALAGAWFLWRVNSTEAAARLQTSEAVRKSVWKWSAVAAMGALMAIGGIVGDQWMCLLFGSNFSLLFWAFFGWGLFPCGGDKGFVEIATMFSAAQQPSSTAAHFSSIFLLLRRTLSTLAARLVVAAAHDICFTTCGGGSWFLVVFSYNNGFGRCCFGGATIFLFCASTKVVVVSMVVILWWVWQLCLVYRRPIDLHLLRRSILGLAFVALALWWRLCFCFYGVRFQFDEHQLGVFNLRWVTMYFVWICYPSVFAIRSILELLVTVL